MREPTSSPAATRGKHVRTDALTQTKGSYQRWLVEVAPCAVAAAWMGLTLAALIGSAATGHRELLDWCRSDAVLAAAGTLAGLIALVGSVRGA